MRTRPRMATGTRCSTIGIRRVISSASSFYSWMRSTRAGRSPIAPILVDNDAAIGRGWTQGYPKRLGQVFQTRYYAATGKAGPALAPGSKFAGSLTASGQRLAEALVTLQEPVTDLSLLRQRPIVNLLHYPRLAADKQDKPVLHELVENVPHDLKIEQAWIGEGALTLPVCRGEEISDLAPVRSGKGIRASMAYVVDDLKTLKDLRK